MRFELDNMSDVGDEEPVEHLKKKNMNFMNLHQVPVVLHYTKNAAFFVAYNIYITRCFAVDMNAFVCCFAFFVCFLVFFSLFFSSGDNKVVSPFFNHKKHRVCV